MIWIAISGIVMTASAAVRPAVDARAQAPAKADAEYLRKAYGTYRSMAETSAYRSIPWQYLGPTNISGRATDIAVADRGTARRIYAGYATSGVWKTDDNGATWQPIFDQHASTSIGDIAVAPSNPDIVWVGTGEANLFRASMAGVGLYKSADGGRTFTHAGLTDSHTIGRIVVHPTNPDIVWVGTGEANLFRASMAGVGLYKSAEKGCPRRSTAAASGSTSLHRTPASCMRSSTTTMKVGRRVPASVTRTAA
ncbi:MAG: hypothetical protein LC804_10085 [Acidobacteria bacterium]|nr:hypothetical protein [Acidobacteriota bacterium]